VFFYFLHYSLYVVACSNALSIFCRQILTSSRKEKSR